MNLSIDITENINYAEVRIEKKIINSISITGGEKEQKVILHIYSEPEFLTDYKQELILEDNQTILNEIPLLLNVEFCKKELLEAGEGVVKAELLSSEDDSEKTLAFESKNVHLQPYTHWNGTNKTLISFLQPNDETVTKIVTRAAELANEEDGKMVGYSKWRDVTVEKQAKWIFRALQEQKIHYLKHPASFEDSGGQKIRIPGQVLQDTTKVGTCIDLAVLYASCLEAASLHALLFDLPGHCFAGVWLKEEARFSAVCDNNVEEIKRACIEGELLPVECTLFTDGENYAFEQAVQAATKQITENKLREVIDVDLGRMMGLTPAFSSTSSVVSNDEIKNMIQTKYENWTAEDEMDKTAVYAFPTSAAEREILSALQEKGSQAIAKSSQKSNLISNIAVEKIRRGKKVLFISDDQNTISDVSRNMENINLKNFYLDLTEDKEKLEEKTSQLQDLLNNKTPKKLVAEYYLENYQEISNLLNKYAKAISTDTDQGISLNALLEKYEEYRDVSFSINIEEDVNHDEALEIIFEYQQLKEIFPNEKLRYLLFLHFIELDEEGTGQVRAKLNETVSSFKELNTAIIDLKKHLKLEADEEITKEEIKKYITYASALWQCPVIGKTLDKGLSQEDDTLIASMLSHKAGSKSYEELKTKLFEKIQPEKMLNTADKSVELDYWQKKYEKACASSENDLRDLEKYKKFDDALTKLLEGKDTEEQEAMQIAVRKIEMGNGDAFKECCRNILKSYKEYSQHQKEIAPIVLKNETEFAEMFPDETKIVLLRAWREFTADQEKFKPYQKILEKFSQKVYKSHCSKMIVHLEEAIEKNKIVLSELRGVAEKSIYRSQIEKRLEQLPKFNDYKFKNYHACLKQYQKLENMAREEYRKKVFNDIIENQLQESIEDDRGTQNFPCIICKTEEVQNFISDNMNFDMVIIDNALHISAQMAEPLLKNSAQSIFFDGEDFEKAEKSIWNCVLEAKVPLTTVESFSAPANKKVENSSEGEVSNTLKNIVKSIENKGYVVDTNIGSGRWKVDAGIALAGNKYYKLGILLNDFTKSENSLEEKEILFPQLLKDQDWNIYQLSILDWYENAENELSQIERLLSESE